MAELKLDGLPFEKTVPPAPTTTGYVPKASVAVNSLTPPPPPPPDDPPEPPPPTTKY
jgi:hypothetical protein